jgi:tyrosinase
MTDSEDWITYVKILDDAKNKFSRYYVITKSFYTAQDDQARAASLVNPTLYNLFIWMHHFSSKDNEGSGVDFAHEATGFLTWHRLFLLWFEREIQLTMNQPDFTFSYWEWTDPDEREKYLTNFLSISRQPFSEWPTYCWYETQDGTICDPTRATRNNLRRCPIETACQMENQGWPSEQDVQHLSISSYDTPPYNKDATKSFRNLLEGFLPVHSCDGESLCKDDVARKLHNSVHLLLGIGDFTTNLDFRKKGVMADVAASPNDPIFINHHTMIDCLMEEWMKCHNSNNDKQYPSSTKINEGHRKNDYIVPFIPLYTHQDMFKTSKTFGYACDLDIEFDCPGGGLSNGAIAGIVIGCVVGFIIIVCVLGFCCICCCACCKEEEKSHRLLAVGSST